MTGLRVSKQLVILPIMALLLFFWTPKTGLAWEVCGTSTEPFNSPMNFDEFLNNQKFEYNNEQFNLYLYNKCNSHYELNCRHVNSPYYNVNPRSNILDQNNNLISLPFPNQKFNEYRNFWSTVEGSETFYACSTNSITLPQGTTDFSFNLEMYNSTGGDQSINYNQLNINSITRNCLCVSNNPPNYSEPVPECTGYTYSSWSSCSSGQQTRSVVSSVPPECSGGVQPSLTQVCVDETATSTIDLDFDNYIAQQSWVNLTGDCSPEETTKLVYVYQSNTTALPSDNYNIVGIQQGISSDFFNVYAEPCDENGRWSRIVFLGKGQNYFTTYTRQQDFGTTWSSVSHGNTVKVLYNYNFDFSLTSPVGVDSFKFGYKYRVFNGKILYGNDDLFLVGHFNNGSLIGNEASFFVDELSPTSSVYYLIRSDIWSGVINDEYKTACDNYPAGCLYALKMDEDELNDSAAAGERLYSISFYDNNNKDNLFARYIFKINWATDPEDPDIVWGLPIDSSWSTSTNPYLPPEQSDETLTQALDRFYTIYSADNICGRDDDDGNVIEKIAKFIPIRICRLGHYLIMPKKVTIERLIGIGDVFLDSFPWSVPFIITNSMWDSLEKAKIAENEQFSIPIPFYYDNATTTIDISDQVYGTINLIGSTKLYWVFNGLTVREVSGVLLTFGVIIFTGVLIFRLVNKKSDPED